MNENILNLDLHPTKLAFTLYVIRQYYTGPLETIQFEPCDCKFAAREAKWRTVFLANDHNLEFWIIFDQDEALSLVWRVVKGKKIEDLGMVHYELRPYHPDSVEKAIKSLPIIKPKTH